MDYKKLVQDKWQADVKIIVFGNGKIWAEDQFGNPLYTEQIGTVEVTAESPRNMLGIYRIVSSEIFNERLEHIHSDLSAVDNAEYHSEEEMRSELSARYGVCPDIIKIELQ